MQRPARQNAGVIGLGIIGSRVAANLRKAGYQTWVWNRTPRPEPNFLSSAAEVAESARVVQIFVSDGPALIETIEAMAPALGSEHVILNHATIAPKETLEAARLVTARNANYLDAPFTGSRDAAEAGQIVFYIGGEIGVLERVRPYLEVNAKAILQIGEVGQAAAIKIATNLMAAVAVGSFAEAMCLLAKSGIPLYKLGEALEQHALHSPLVDLKMPPMITADFEPQLRVGVEVVRGFVEHQQVRAAEEDAGQFEPASLPARQRSHGQGQAVVREAESGRDRSGLRLGLVAAGVAVGLLGPGEPGDVAVIVGFLERDAGLLHAAGHLDEITRGQDVLQALDEIVLAMLPGILSKVAQRPTMDRAATCGGCLPG